MEPKPPRMIREDDTKLRAALIAMVVLNALLLAGLVVTGGVLISMAGSERFSRAVAVRLHLAPREEVQAAEERAQGAQAEASLTRQFAQQEVTRFQDIGNEITDFRAVVTDLQGQLNSLQDVGRIEDLATQIADVQGRLEAACAWAREAARTREESIEASFRAYVARAC
jgi:hypothetical protein